MKTLISLATILIMAGLVYPVSASPANGEIRIYLSRRTDTPPQIDGKLDDDGWQGVPQMSGFTLITGERGLAQQQTIGRIVHSGNSLYIGVEMLESHIKELRAVYRERDSRVWEDDCLEIFIDTNHDRRTYYHFIANSLGTQYDGRGVDKSWDGDWKVKTSLGEKSWIAEISIPFTTLNAQPEKGALWGFNLTRARYPASIMELSAWSNLGEKSFHVPERFGYLVFESFEEQLRKDLSALKIKREEIAKLLKSNTETEEFEGKFEKICRSLGKIKESLEPFFLENVH